MSNTQFANRRISLSIRETSKLMALTEEDIYKWQERPESQERTSELRMLRGLLDKLSL